MKVDRKLEKVDCKLEIVDHKLENVDCKLEKVIRTIRNLEMKVDYFLKAKTSKVHFDPKKLYFLFVLFFTYCKKIVTE